jgi:hypothetical protein
MMAGMSGDFDEISRRCTSEIAGIPSKYFKIK